MRLFDVQGIEIQTSRERLFDFVRDPRNLPKWAHAFHSADSRRARLQTPSGKVDITLQTEANPKAGTEDWRLEFPDKSIALAQSCVTETTRGTCIYSFVLHAPPVRLGKSRARSSSRARRSVRSCRLSSR